jgi:hypothetical protein
VLTAKHFLDFPGLDFLIERLEGLSELGIDRFARARPLEEDGEIVSLFSQGHHQIAILLDAAAPLQDFLRFGLIFPEFGGGRPCFEAGQFFVEAGTFKDSSADRQRAC